MPYITLEKLNRTVDYRLNYPYNYNAYFFLVTGILLSYWAYSFWLYGHYYKELGIIGTIGRVSAS
jgi:hypothetical protein